MSKLTTSPAHKLLSTFDPEVRKVLKELNVKYVEFGDNFYRFEHAGYTCEITFKAKQNES